MENALASLNSKRSFDVFKSFRQHYGQHLSHWHLRSVCFNLIISSSRYKNWFLFNYSDLWTLRIWAQNFLYFKANNGNSQRVFNLYCLHTYLSGRSRPVSRSRRVFPAACEWVQKPGEGRRNQCLKNSYHNSIVSIWYWLGHKRQLINFN